MWWEPLPCPFQVFAGDTSSRDVVLSPGRGNSKWFPFGLSNHSSSHSTVTEPLWEFCQLLSLSVPVIHPRAGKSLHLLWVGYQPKLHQSPALHKSTMLLGVSKIHCQFRTYIQQTLESLITSFPQWTVTFVKASGPCGKGEEKDSLLYMG